MHVNNIILEETKILLRYKYKNLLIYARQKKGRKWSALMHVSKAIFYNVSQKYFMRREYKGSFILKQGFLYQKRFVFLTLSLSRLSNSSGTFIFHHHWLAQASSRVVANQCSHLHSSTRVKTTNSTFCRRLLSWYYDLNVLYFDLDV